MVDQGDRPSLLAGRVLEQQEIAPGHFRMALDIPAWPSPPLPGQFAMIHLQGRNGVLLGRPLSIYAYRADQGCATVQFLYRVVGRGTTALSGLHPGAPLDILGPLGNGFTLRNDGKTLILVAGGLGVAPLTFLAAHCRSRMGVARPRIVAYLGATCADRLVGMEELQAACDQLNIITDDGSCGTCGVVTDALQRDLETDAPSGATLYACGPSAMLRCLADMLRDHPLPCQVSVEERMACGIGACLGCAIPVRMNGERQYRRVCKDGPVFDLQDLLWE